MFKISARKQERPADSYRRPFQYCVIDSSRNLKYPKDFYKNSNRPTDSYGESFKVTNVLLEIENTLKFEELSKRLFQLRRFV